MIIVVVVGGSVAVSVVPILGLQFLIYILMVWAIYMMIYAEKRHVLMILGIWSIILLSLFDEMSSSIIDVFVHVERVQSSFMIKLCTTCITMFFLLTTGILMKRSGKGHIKQIGLPYMLAFTLMIVADTYVLTILGDFIMELDGVRNNWYLRIAYVIVVLGMFFQIMLVLLLIVSRNDFREKERIAQKYLENQIQHYQYLEQRELETKKFRHDLRSHMFALQSYMQKKQYGEMETHLTQMYGAMEAFEKKISVNNDIVDAILNKYDAECKRQGIEFIVKGHFPIQCEVSVYDLCTIFSNLLSNAFEAAAMVENGQIIVNIRYTDTELLIWIENDYEGTVVVEHGRLRTKKADAEYHGIGLENVKTCVEKNYGNMYIETVEQRFVVKISLARSGDENENSNS